MYVYVYVCACVRACVENVPVVLMRTFQSFLQRMNFDPVVCQRQMFPHRSTLELLVTSGFVQPWFSWIWCVLVLSRYPMLVIWVWNFRLCDVTLLEHTRYVCFEPHYVVWYQNLETAERFGANWVRCCWRTLRGHGLELHRGPDTSDGFTSLSNLAMP